MKKILITLLTFIFCIAPVDISAKENSIILKADCTFIEYGSPVGNVKSFLDTDEMTSTAVSNTTMDTSSLRFKQGKNYPEVGEYTIKFKYGSETVYSTLVVEDTTDPEFTQVKNITTYQGVKPDYKKYYKVSDLSSFKVTINDTKVNYSKIGDYEVELKATDVYGNWASESINVEVKKPTLSLNKTKATLYKGQTMTLKPTIKGGSKKISYKSSNKSIATVDSKGKITAKKKGKVTITAKANGVTKKCTITIKNPSISLSSKKTMYIKQKASLNAKIYGKSTKATYKSSNKKIATVDKNGKITCKKSGTTTITVKANGVTKKCKITVKKAGIILSASKTVTVKKSINLNAKIYGKSKKVTYKTDNKYIATVNSKGKVTGKRQGTCTITVKANGVTKKCKIKVKAAPRVPELSKEAFNLINRERTKRGLPKYKWDDKLASLAKTRAKECTILFSHFRPDGSLPPCSGETLVTASDAQTAIKRWMNSQGHKEILIHKKHTKCAVARIESNYQWKDISGKTYKTPSKYMWVAVFQD